MIPHMSAEKLQAEDQSPPSLEEHTKRRRSFILRLGAAMIIALGGMLTLWGYFLPIATYSDMAHRPVFVQGNANFLLPFIAIIVIGLSGVVVLQTKRPWLPFLCLGIALFVGMVTHYVSCVILVSDVGPSPLSGPGYFDFDIGALLPFVGLILSLVGLILSIIASSFRFTGSKPLPSQKRY